MRSVRPGFFKWLSLLLIFIFLSITSCKKISSEIKKDRKRIKKEAKVTESSLNKSVVSVVVCKAKRKNLPLSITLSGIACVREKGEILSPVDGYVDKIFFKEGDRVRKGELVIKLKNRDIELALKVAKARKLKAMAKFVVLYRSMSDLFGKDKKDNEIKKGKEEYEKALKLFKEGKIDRRRLDEVEDRFLESMIRNGGFREEVQRVISGLTEADIYLERERILYERRFIKAPFSGTISEVMVSPGRRVLKGDGLFKIVNLNSMFIKADILETELSKVRKRERVIIRFPSFPKKVFFGRVIGFSPEVNERYRTVTLLIDFKNPGYIFDGMNCEVDLIWKVLRNVVVVPRRAIVVRSGRPLLFVVRNNVALWRYVQIGEGNDREVEIKSGVNDGEDVVVEGQMTLSHQSKVKIVKRW